MPDALFGLKVLWVHNSSMMVLGFRSGLEMKLFLSSPQQHGLVRDCQSRLKWGSAFSSLGVPYQSHPLTSHWHWCSTKLSMERVCYVPPGDSWKDIQGKQALQNSSRWQVLGFPWSLVSSFGKAFRCCAIRSFILFKGVKLFVICNYISRRAD